MWHLVLVEVLQLDKFCIFVVLRAVWEPNYTFLLYKGLFGFKLCIFTALGAV